MALGSVQLVSAAVQGAGDYLASLQIQEYLVLKYLPLTAACPMRKVELLYSLFLQLLGVKETLRRRI